MMKLGLILFMGLFLVGIAGADSGSITFRPGAGISMSETNPGDAEMNGGDLKNATYVNTTYYSSGEFVGDLEMGSHTIYNGTLDFVDVSAFGANGNGSDQTSAINAAIAVANDHPENKSENEMTFKTLYFPRGIYTITLGGLDPIRCKVYARDATFVAAAGGNWNDPMFTIGSLRYANIVIGDMWGYDANLSAGPADDVNLTPNGIGIYVVGSDDGGRNVDYNKISVNAIVGFSRGVWLDGDTYDIHIASNTVDVGILCACGGGFWTTSGTYQIENNNIHSAYTVSCEYSYGLTGDYQADAGWTQDNIITVDLLEMHRRVYPAYGFYLEGSGVRSNVIDIKKMLYNETSSTPVYVGGTVTNNRLFMPYHDVSRNTLRTSGNNTIQIMYPGPTGPSPPSIIYGYAAPSSGNWQQRDICYNLNPAAGGTMGWVCTTAGTPGTWKTFGAIAA